MSEWVSEWMNEWMNEWVTPTLQLTVTFLNLFRCGLDSKIKLTRILCTSLLHEPIISKVTKNRLKTPFGRAGHKNRFHIPGIVTASVVITRWCVSVTLKSPDKIGGEGVGVGMHESCTDERAPESDPGAINLKGRRTHISCAQIWFITNPLFILLWLTFKVFCSAAAQTS